MNAHSRESLDLFLTGRLGGRAREAFFTQVKNDPDLRRSLELATEFEALAYSMAWWVNRVPGLDNDADWAAAAGHAGGKNSEILSEQEWQSLFDTVFSETDVQKPLRPSKTAMFRFPRPVRYLAAACLAALAIGIGLVWIRHGASGTHPPRIIAMGQIRPDSGGGPSLYPAAGAATSSIVFDSLVIYRIQGVYDKRIQPKRGDGVVELGKKTAVLLEKNSVCEITRNGGDTIAVSLNSGDALFTVEKNRYRSFTVHTPFSEIRVTGTVFRVRAEDEMTVISVLEGAVRSRRGDDTATILIGAGMTARISKRVVILERGDTAATMPYRCHILRDFLEENGIWEDGRFVRTGIGAAPDTVERRFRSLRRALFDKEPAAGPRVFSFVRQFPNSSMAGELLLDLAAMHERSGDYHGAFAVLDSAVTRSDNDHAAAALYRLSLLSMDTLRDLGAARNTVARYLSRFPYDPRSFSMLERLIGRYWDRGRPDSADAALARITAFAGPDARLERIVFNHAEKWRTAKNGRDKALRWYAFLLERYPKGNYAKAADDKSRQCIIQYGISRHKARAQAIDTFLHPEGDLQ